MYLAAHLNLLFYDEVQRTRLDSRFDCPQDWAKQETLKATTDSCTETLFDCLPTGASEALSSCLTWVGRDVWLLRFCWSSAINVAVMWADLAGTARGCYSLKSSWKIVNLIVTLYYLSLLRIKFLTQRQWLYSELSKQNYMQLFPYAGWGKTVKYWNLKLMLMDAEFQTS